jgi:hypothetical protein
VASKRRNLQVVQGNNKREPVKEGWGCFSSSMSSGEPFHYLGFIEVGDGDAENFQGVLGTMYGVVLDLRKQEECHCQ